MIDEKPPRFKFNGDELDSDNLFQDEMKDLRIEKLSQRVTIITILIPILIGVLIFIAYRDISSRVLQTQDTEVSEIQNLSKDLNDKFTTLTGQYQDLEKSLSQKLSTLEANIKSLEDKYKKTEASLANLNASKIEKKAIDDALAPIRNELKSLAAIRKDLDEFDPVRKDLKTVSAQIKKLDDSLNKDLPKLTSDVEKAVQDMGTLKAELTSLSKQKADRDELKLELLKAKKLYQLSLSEEINKIQEKLDSLQKSIGGMGTSSGLLRGEQTSSLTSGVTSSAGGIISEDSQKELGIPKTGGLLEQDITE